MVGEVGGQAGGMGLWPLGQDAAGPAACLMALVLGDVAGREGEAEDGFCAPCRARVADALGLGPQVRLAVERVAARREEREAQARGFAEEVARHLEGRTEGDGFAVAAALLEPLAPVVSEVPLTMCYDARARAALRRFVALVGLPWATVLRAEAKRASLSVAHAVHAARVLEEGEAKGRMKEVADQQNNTYTRMAAIGAASVLGGVAIALTGGLAAPALGAGFAAMGGIGVAMAAGMATTGGVIAVNSVFAGAGAVFLGSKAARRTAAASGIGFVDSTAKARHRKKMMENLRRRREALMKGAPAQGKVDDVGREHGRDRSGKAGESGREGSSSWFSFSSGSTKEKKGAKYAADGARPEDPEWEAKVIEVERELEVVMVRQSEADNALHATICVSGWITSTEEASQQLEWVYPWEDIQAESGPLRGALCLTWEPEVCLQITNALTDMVKKQLISQGALSAGAALGVGATLAALAAPLAVVAAANLVDNAWAVGTARAEKVGEMLAELLSAQSEDGADRRPVTLVGVGLGGAVVSHCLLNLAKRQKSSRAKRALVERAYIIGAPLTSSRTTWSRMESVVCGELVNAYHPHDWVLALLFRGFSAVGGSVNLEVAGLCPIHLPEPGVLRNVDLSKIATLELDGVAFTSADYAKNMSFILAALGLAEQPKITDIITSPY